MKAKDAMTKRKITKFKGRSSRMPILAATYDVPRKIGTVIKSRCMLKNFFQGEGLARGMPLMLKLL